MGIIGFFHQFDLLRRLAKLFARNIVIKQKFHGGYIYLNSVDHAWAWTGSKRYESFDKHIQSFIYQKSKDFQYFIDIGSNLGVMTIGTLLYNSKIHAIAIDPNSSAIKLLNKSLAYNNLSSRCKTINAAVGLEAGVNTFDLTGSVTGHISSEGTEVNVIKFSELLNQFNIFKTLVKIDIEGFESIVLQDLKLVDHLSNFTFILELHPLGFNEYGNPQKVFDGIKELNAIITDLEGNAIDSVGETNISQLFICFN